MLIFSHIYVTARLSASVVSFYVYLTESGHLSHIQKANKDYKEATTTTALVLFS